MAYMVVTTIHTLGKEATHIDLNDMIKAISPAHKQTSGNRVDVVLTGAGDTAYAPGTTKKVFLGPGSITYLIAPSGVEAYVMPGAAPALVYIR